MSCRKWGAGLSAALLSACIFFGPAVGWIDATCDSNDCENIVNRCRQIDCTLKQIQFKREWFVTIGISSDSFDFGDYKKNHEPALQTAFNVCGIDGATDSPSGRTDENCNVTLKAKTSCMKQSVFQHETHHQETCRRIYDERSFCTQWMPWRGGYAGCMTWDEYMQDEAEAYSIEKNYLNGELNYLKAKGQCTSMTCDATAAPGSVTEMVHKIIDYFY